MNTIIISICSLAISVLSVGSAIYFNSKSSKHTDVEEIKQRVEESTRTNMKLDEIGRNVNDIKFDMTSTKNAVQNLTERVVSVEGSAKQAHHRLDRVERVLDIKEDGNNDA